MVSRTIASVYVTALIELLVSAQFALTGKYLYLYHLMKRAQFSPNSLCQGLDGMANVTRNFLEISRHFASEGSTDLIASVSSSASLVLAKYSTILAL